MAQGKRGGFHSLEKKIHDMEEQDRTPERKAGAEGGPRRESKGEKESAERRTPPAAHDE
jgi:hypothetical protein